MALQGSVLPDHVPVNNFVLAVIGSGKVPANTTFFFVEVSGIELETQAVDLPDRTKASGGQFGAQEFTAKSMMHHGTERSALEGWFTEGQNPVTATYKKSCTLTHKTLSNATKGVYTLSGVWIMKRKLPDLSTEDEGAPAMIEWTFSVDKTTRSGST
jgi:hypothetical protein